MSLDKDRPMDYSETESDDDSSSKFGEIPTAPRKRDWPLIPEPFQHLSVSRQFAFLGSPTMAARHCGFCIDLDIPNYREQLPQDKQDELDRKADLLLRRFIENHVFGVSEFGWEADVWSIVFGSIRDDPVCHM